MNGEPQPEQGIKTNPRRPAPALFARIVGAFLCLAAGLKIFEVYDYPQGGIGERVLLVASGVEFLLGVALLLRVWPWPRVFVPAAALLFIALAVMSMIGVGRDVRRCGCLGPIPMPPWGMMILDGAAATALIWTLLGSGRWRDQHLPRLAAASIVAGFVGLTTGSIYYRKPPPNNRYLSSQLIAESDVFTITPDRFKDRPFYLADFIRIDVDLRRGKWKVILTRPWCPRCDRRLRAIGCEAEGDERVAIVQVGGKQDWPPPRECKAVLGYLTEDKTWIFDAPLIFRLADGVVIPEQ